MRGVTDVRSILDRCIEFTPEQVAAGFLKLVPAKWVVYLFADADDRPVQLLCVRSLRDSLKRRLFGEESIGPTRRVNYRELVRRVYWRRVDSALEADWVYLEAARRLFPRTYQGMVGFRSAWFVHVDPQASFPRYTKTIDLLKAGPGELIGPVEDKHAAARLMQLAEDAYDLCRYYNVLLESPRGRACAYKEMGKCPAPCDGTVSMEHYRSMVVDSVRAVTSPAGALEALEGRMRKAAGELRFEEAGRLKAKLDLVGQLGRAGLRHARTIEAFQFLSLQRGPREAMAKVFLIVKGRIEEGAGLISEPVKPAELLRLVLTRAAELARTPLDEPGVERIGLVSNHLFSPKRGQGVYLRLDSIDEKAVAKAYRELGKQKGPEEVTGEGVMKELQEMA